MTREQRMDYMGLVVFPKMKAVFVEHDAETYAEFACQTCHGDDMEMVDFKMPRQSLYSLPQENPVEAARDYHAGTADFMVDRVVPEMAELLGMEPYDAESGQGFGCFGCHPVEGE